jgi:hypothetical protein
MLLGLYRIRAPSPFVQDFCGTRWDRPAQHRDELAAFHSITSRAATTPKRRLIRSFDDELPYYFDCLITLRRKVLPGCRVDPCLRLIQAVPLAETHTLGSHAHDCNNLSSSAETSTTGGLLRSLVNGAIRSSGRGIEHFAIGDNVGFGLCLGVQPLHGRCAKCCAYNDGQHDSWTLDS